MAALFHDVGMMLIPSEIRTKPGKLSIDEWYEVQKHPVLGLHLLEKVSNISDIVSLTAYQTHERENGKGYPKQRPSRFIHRFAKIVQIADVFEALSSPRSYRGAYIPYHAMEMIIKMSRQGLIPGDFVKSFLEYVSLFPVGSIVELSDHRLGKVVKANTTSLSKPTVSILVNEVGRTLAKDQIYQEDLSENTTVQIVKAYTASYLENIGIMDGF
ncbi:MAG: HD domain-containing protein [Chitinivibrionales bacterium]|nr:HD domain-containing protein [Chitinivibrionales bacterium]